MKLFSCQTPTANTQRCTAVFVWY